MLAGLKKKKKTEGKQVTKMLSDVFRNGVKNKPVQNGVLFSIDSSMQSSKESGVFFFKQRWFLGAMQTVH